MRLKKKAAKKKGRSRTKKRAQGGALKGQRSAQKKKDGVVTAEHASAILIKGFQPASAEDSRLFGESTSIGFTLNLGDYSSIKMSVNLGGRFDADQWTPEEATTLLTNECITQLNNMCEQVGVKSFDQFVEEAR